MCDSKISVSCPSDFTKYCPANSLDSNEYPLRARQRQHASRTKTVSHVKSHIAWFSRKARGELYSCKANVCNLPFGEDRCDLEIWSSSSGDEERVGAKARRGMSSLPRKSVSREELDAMRGCVSRRRALFSPSPSSSPKHSSAIETPVRSFSNKGLETRVLQKIMPNEKVGRCNSLPLPHVQQISNAANHLRQQSFEYDHLEDYSTENPNVTLTSKKVVPDSVSVQFGPAGYESKAVCETDQSGTCNPEKEKSQLRVTATSHVYASTNDINKYSNYKKDKDQIFRNTLLPISHSIPGRLDSSSLSCKHLTEQCGICQCCLCGSSRNVMDPAISRTYHSDFQSQYSACNSWPRSQICSTVRVNARKHAANGVVPKTRNSIQSLHQKCSPFCSPHQSPRHGPYVARIKSSKFNLKENEITEASNLLLCKNLTELGSSHSVCSCHSYQSVSTTNSSWCDHPHVMNMKGVEGQQFKDRSDVSTS